MNFRKSKNYYKKRDRDEEVEGREKRTVGTGKREGERREKRLKEERVVRKRKEVKTCTYVII